MYLQFIYLFNLVCLLINSVYCDIDSELLSVVVIFRHGDRTPVAPYPNDPYKNQSYWPVGFGQLTNRGKIQHYLLGKWYRQHYADFLPGIYSENDIYVRSSDVDRTLMSAASHLAGLYPPQGDQIWNPDILWQPIPIHTVPELQDPILAMKKPCPKYNALLKALFKTEFFRNVTHKNHDLYAYLTRYSGNTISSLEQLEYLYNVFFIESSYNFTLPNWTYPVYPEKMLPSAQLSFATACYTTELARLKSGLLFNEIVEHFLNRARNTEKAKKYIIYSGHDTTIANVLNTLGAFQYHCPPYASSIIMELRRPTDNSSNFINIFYKNSTELQKIILKGCEFNCKLDDFIKNLQPILLNIDEWHQECEISIIRFDEPFTFIVILSILGCLFLLLGAILASVKCRKNQYNTMSYTQLPNDEVA